MWRECIKEELVLWYALSDGPFPFTVNGAHWRFAYCDPAYEARVAYSQGRTIEYHRKDNPADEWYTAAMGVVDTEHYDYRVKPAETEHAPKTRFMNNKELAKWCADGKGQCSTYDICYTTYSYSSGDDTKIPRNIKIREWNSDEWHEPLVEVR